MAIILLISMVLANLAVLSRRKKTAKWCPCSVLSKRTCRIIHEPAFVKSFRSHKQPLGRREPSGLVDDSNDAVSALLHTSIQFMSVFFADSQVVPLFIFRRPDSVEQKKMRELTEISKGKEKFYWRPLSISLHLIGKLAFSFTVPREKEGSRGFPPEKRNKSVDLGVYSGEEGGFRGSPPKKRRKSVDLGIYLGAYLEVY